METQSSTPCVKSDQKTPEKRSSLSLEYGVARAMGGRKYQEDEYTCVDHLTRHGGPAYFGIYDGHGSDYYSAHASMDLYRVIQNHIEEIRGKGVLEAMVSAFREEDRLMSQTVKGRPVPEGGSTATAALILGDELFLANVGDSRAVLAIRESTGKLKAVRLSKDHKPDDPEEKQRIEKVGGVVQFGRVLGPNTAINMSRALGDFEFKVPLNKAQADFITGTPYVAPPVRLRPEVKFLVLASDGLWNQMEDQEVVDEILVQREAGLSVSQIAEKLAHKCGSVEFSDNITIILVFLEYGNKKKGEKESHAEVCPPGDAVVHLEEGDEVLISKHVASDLQQ